ncbi:hypothetical protein [Pseudomonas aeruginosa]|uniref:hypothetical protein n=1 Tax=Pseudomonas aeruginosa TaxID=287 RepID=UPI000F81B460|nr:hypothetical protein [Pseudomonas aeruginosa]EJB8398210.1 hypothetical protein [Pseudomonas aeruginosa]NTT46805.1 hypothetical protein [Pseudomonas aeruginosa]RTS97951.1 hypothetical protein DY949_00245 [Pseudomonas aeruginosa]HBO1568909.1 hypothetical protein [Pseudomonas aeruginosa]HBO1569960.1 hypothetical protein [Pseudomonas aeruginosa]
MEIPKGTIWDSVHTESLEAIPEGVEPDLRKVMSFYQWREKGGYHVSGSTQKEFLISCAARELGSVLLNEATNLNNQALEHKAIIGSALASGRTLSSSWLLVTTYYWCVYLALSWLRMTGQIVTYLPSNEIERFKKLNLSNGKSPANGTFITKIEDEYGSKRTIKLQRLKSNNFHEGLWAAFNKDITSRLELLKGEPASMEFRIFSCLNLASYADGHSWPSKIRNIVNYKVGLAYGEMYGQKKPNLIEIGEKIKQMNLPEILSLHEESQIKVSSTKSANTLEKHSELLMTFGAILSSVHESHLQEIHQKRNIEISTAVLYRQYLKKHELEPDGFWIKNI